MRVNITKIMKFLYGSVAAWPIHAHAGSLYEVYILGRFRSRIKSFQHRKFPPQNSTIIRQMVFSKSYFP